MSVKILCGSVIKCSSLKTVVVSVTKIKKHPLYGKRFENSKKYHVHNPNCVKFSSGDVVKIVESRPISKLKKWLILYWGFFIMIIMESVLTVADNSGATEVKCIRVVGGKVGRVGDVIVVSVTKAPSSSSIKSGSVCKAVIVRTKSPIKRKDGVTLRFDDNAAVLIDAKSNLEGTRVFGPVAREVKSIEIRSKASEVL